MTGTNEVAAAGRAVIAADHKVHDALEGEHGRISVKILGALSDIGDQPQLRTICCGVIALGLLRRSPLMIFAGARMLLTHEVATAAKSAVKHRVDRTRPRSARDRSDEMPHAGHSTDKEENSFPSGHSSGALAVAAAYSAVYPQHRAPALMAASAVALAQIPRRAHYPSDVGAGLAIGAASHGVVSGALALSRLVLKRIGGFSVPWSR